VNDHLQDKSAEFHLAKKRTKKAVNVVDKVPTESQEQKALIQWCNAQSMGSKLNGARYIFAIPNGGKRNIITAVNMKAEGVKAGVPDLFLPVPMGRFHGLFIEMKRKKGGTVSNEQEDCGFLLGSLGYMVMVCRGADEAEKTITEYLSQ